MVGAWKVDKTFRFTPGDQKSKDSAKKEALIRTAKLGNGLYASQYNIKIETRPRSFAVLVQAKHKMGSQQKGWIADLARKAKPPGKRTSSSGKTYYESRRNRSDRPGSRV